jgi:hypothetical protein
MFGKKKFRKGNRVYMTSNGLIKVNVEGNSLELWVKETDIQGA